MLHPARPSLLRAILLAIGSFLCSLRLGGFPDINALHSSRWQLVPAVFALGAVVETNRCMGPRWTLYNAGILILLYTDIMILGMAVFLFFYP